MQQDRYYRCMYVNPFHDAIYLGIHLISVLCKIDIIREVHNSKELYYNLGPNLILFLIGVLLSILFYISLTQHSPLIYNLILCQARIHIVLYELNCL